MAGGCRGGLAGARDRALLLLAASGLGRAALPGLDDRPPITVHSRWRGRGTDLPKQAAVASAFLVRRSNEAYPTVPLYRRYEAR